MTDGYLIMKRGLYYRLNSRGYTGIRDQAGRYPLEQAKDLADHSGGSITFVHEDDAEEFTPAAFHDLVIDHLKGKIEELRAQLAVLKEAA